jgi:hypothetical protein
MRYTVEIEKACRYLNTCVGTNLPRMQPYQPSRGVSSGKLYWSEETFRIFECDQTINRP